MHLGLITLFVGVLIQNGCNLESDAAGNGSTAGSAPRILGVTEGSVYIDDYLTGDNYVQIYLYPHDSCAEVSKDGGPPQTISFAGKIRGNGSYELKAWHCDEPDHTNVISFTIDDTKQAPLYRTNVDNTGVQIQIDFEDGVYYVREDGRNAIPIFAVWAEDLSGGFLQNIYISNYPATNYPRNDMDPVRRPAALPYWMHKAGEEVSPGTFLSNPENNVPSDLDAVTGATCMTKYRVVSRVKANPADGDLVKVFFEIQQSWDSSWYFVRGVSCPSTEGEPSVVYSTTVDLAQSGIYMLGGTDTPIGPVGHSHPYGENGLLYTDLYKIDPQDGQEKYIFDHAHKMAKRITVTVP